MNTSKKNLLSPKVVLFDWDGTLVNTDKIYKGVLAETLKEMGMSDWNKEAAEKYRFHSRREALPLIFGNKWREVNDKYVDKIQKIGMHALNPFPNALNLIEYLAEENVIMSIVSNKDSYHLREEVNYLGWSKYFHKIVGATDAPKDKPWPDPVHLALREQDIQDYNEVWFLGDSLVDMQCAKSTGCMPILFGTETGAHTQMQYLRIDYLHIHDHEELVTQYKQLK
ncbi:MAG: HAD family hydrolase [Candidatus Midichloria sp.]|nr:HAD family hydrolase [Candidatus Midichloria sp.]